MSAVIRDHLIDVCERHRRATRELDDPSGDRRLLREAFSSAQSAIALVSTDQEATAYVAQVRASLEELANRFRANDADDPDRWRVAAINTTLREIDAIAEAL